MGAEQVWDVQVEWGLAGLRRLARTCDVLVIVDVLSFCTCVEIAASRGAAILPFRQRGEAAGEYARRQNAQLAGPRQAGGYSLSPASLLGLPSGARLVLPSPNGATLSQAAGRQPAFAGCLRNALATGWAAEKVGRVGVVPAGERWPGNRLRFALEDFLGAGAIIWALSGSKSPEALAAESAFARFEKELEPTLQAIRSGQELIERGFGEDVRLAAELNVSQVAARLVAGAFVSYP